ncbi:hypothetical protein ACHAXH_005844 [Discostella pseudostelligera]
MGKLERTFGGGKGKKGPKSNHHHKGKPSSSSLSSSSRHKKVEVTFNPSERREYLTGFSTRKKERRAFGLAMQKVKDREAKLEERKEQREAQREKIEDIERNKVALRKGMQSPVEDGVDVDDGNCADGDQIASSAQEQERKTFQDEHTANQFGGSVSVTTTFGIPSDDDEDGDIDDLTNPKSQFYARKQHGPGHVDEAQKLAGNFRNYISDVKGTMGSKNKSTGRQAGRKGQHGASTMKGMGNAASLKMAKKTLAKFKKGGKRGDDERIRGGSGGGKGKKRKGGRR